MRHVDCWRGEYGNEYHASRSISGLKRSYLLESLFKDCGRDDIILEVGCGTGSNLVALKILGLTAYGWEPNAQALDEAQRKGVNVFPWTLEYGAGLSSDTLRDETTWALTCGLLGEIEQTGIEKALSDLSVIAKKGVVTIEAGKKGEADHPAHLEDRPIPLWVRDYTGRIPGFLTENHGETPGEEGLGFMMLVHRRKWV